MTSKFEASFLFVTCQVGAEPALKSEISREHPSLKFAYSKPGFLTFKQTGDSLGLDFELRSVFARSYGLSIGRVKLSELSKLPEIIQNLLTTGAKKKLRLHIWERDFYAPGEEPKGFQNGVLAQKWEKSVREQFSEFFENQAQATPDDLVMDLIILEEDLAWVGSHLHSSAHSPWPGGRPPLTLPKEAPSRAYLKLEESLVWSGTKLRRGDTAVEIGSAPGGASFALIERGLNVVGIDPAKMAPYFLQQTRFQHIQKPVADVLREDLPEHIQWFLLDMNVEPRISLFAVDRLVSRMRSTLLGIFLTIKLNDWKIADQIPSMIDHVRAMGMVRIKAAQLSSCRQEIMIFGLTRRGLSRKG